MVKFMHAGRHFGLHNDRQVATFWAALGLATSIATIAVLLVA